MELRNSIRNEIFHNSIRPLGDYKLYWITIFFKISLGNSYIASQCQIPIPCFDPILDKCNR